MNQISGFLRLQQIDTRLDQVKTRFNQINVLLEDDQKILQIVKQKEKVKQIIDSSTKQLELSEKAIQAHHIKIQQVEANLYSGNVKNPKELQDLQSEIDSLKRHYSSLENTQFQIMIGIEGDQKDYEFLSKNHALAEQDFNSKNLVLLDERNIILKEIERLESEKTAAEKSISAQDLSFYNELRLRKGGVAVSIMSDRVCNSCGATLTPAQEQAVKSPKNTIYCPSCGRMLYFAK
jgi:predicted  nucleic acid-binding Zn-ribbon protein